MDDKEQKPRTREEQVSEIAIIAEDPGCVSNNCFGWARRQVMEAEERGAAETRKAFFLDSVSSASRRIVDRPDIIQWQKDGNQFFDATIREIVEEYAEWRDKRELKAPHEDVKGQQPVGWYLEEEGCRPWLSHTPVKEEDAIKQGLTVSPLYTHPANVAELGARVADLENALLKIRDSALFCSTQQLRYIAGKVLKK